MSRHYILDGYNILKKIDAFNNLPLEEGRGVFLKWIVTARPQGSTNNQLTVVFDGHPDHFGFTGTTGGVRVVFSNGCSADDVIKRMMDEADNPKNCVVVTDDKDVFLYARALGAKIMTVAAFTAQLKTTVVVQEGDSKYIPISRQHSINEELARIWLKDK